jgi:serine/threonine protein kinase
VAARTLGGRFVLEAPIGQGGFADVYRAVDKKDAGTPVAVKILRDVESVKPEVIRRFRRELRLLEGMHHENVIPILGHGDTDDEGIWYAMPLAAGSLVDFLPEITSNYPAILDLMRQICAGLKYVHQQPIYHRTSSRPTSCCPLTAPGRSPISGWRSK